jgi:serine protease Do
MGDERVLMRTWFPAVVLTAVVSFLLGLVAAGGRATRRVDIPPRVTAGNAGAERANPNAAATPPVPLPVGVDFATVAARLNAAVVSVDTTSRDSEDRSRLVVPQRWPNDVHEGSGSGFVIDASGLILTNYHVVNDADRVTVTLGDGRSFKATVVGVDPEIDIALLQVPTKEPLTAAPLGQSTSLRVGEWVCAIGNPLGYPHSVTVGVVSFLGRKVFDASLDALIQTDAAITFGNSGGPLINARGEVVGVTAAISSQAANIGFAVPIDQVVAILPQLREVGRVSRGNLGIGVTTMTSGLRRALALDPPSGVLVQDVTVDTPAERAGLRPYDVIQRVDDRPMTTDDDLTRYISARQPGTVVRLEFWRDGGARSVPVRLAERPVSMLGRARSARASAVQPASRDDQLLGVRVVDLDAATAKRKGLPETTVGVLVANVDPAGPARAASVREGQVLLEINRQPVGSAVQFRAIVAGLRPGSPVALFLYDSGVRQRLIIAFVTDPPS